MVDVRHGRPRGRAPVILAPSVAPLLATIEETYTREAVRAQRPCVASTTCSARSRSPSARVALRVRGAVPRPDPRRGALPTGGDDPEGNSAARARAFFVACDRRVGPRDHPDEYEARAVDLAVEADRRWALQPVVVGDEWADAHHERDAALAAAPPPRARTTPSLSPSARPRAAPRPRSSGLVPFRVAVVDPGDGTGTGRGRGRNMRRRLPRRPRPHPWERS